MFTSIQLAGYVHDCVLLRLTELGLVAALRSNHKNRRKDTPLAQRAQIWEVKFAKLTKLRVIMPEDAPKVNSFFLIA